MTHVDPPLTGILAVYPPSTWPALEASGSALLVIDLQRLCAAPDRGMFARAAELGLAELMVPYGRRLEELVLPNVRALVDTFRGAGVPVVYTRIQSSTEDGSDRSGGHIRLGLHVPPGHPDGEILDEVAPAPQDTVVSKTTSGAFVGTDLQVRLESMGVHHLAVCGVLTNECVESTVRHAADLGFTVSLPEDACAGVEHDLHEATVRTLARTYARIVTTDQVRRELGAGR